MTNPIFVAIDTPYLDDALELTRRIKDQVGGIKVIQIRGVDCDENRVGHGRRD